MAKIIIIKCILINLKRNPDGKALKCEIPTKKIHKYYNI